MKAQISPSNRKLLRLIRDYGYDFQGNILIERGIRGFCSDRIVGTRRDLFDAADSLLNVVKDEEYSSRFTNIGKD